MIKNFDNNGHCYFNKMEESNYEKSNQSADQVPANVDC